MKITVIDECCDMYKADLSCLSKVIIFVRGVYFHPPPPPTSSFLQTNSTSVRRTVCHALFVNQIMSSRFLLRDSR